MENALLIGLSYQVALGRELEVVANNVANINTTGFKADGAVFEEYLMPVASADQFPPPDRTLRYVQDRTTWHDFRQGPIQTTGNPLDVAVDGNAFLVVQTAAGERFTRNGALQINAAGQLVTSEGLQVVGDSGPIVFQTGDTDIRIAEDGAITVRESANPAASSSRGKLRLVSFAEPDRLVKEGSSLFVPPQDVQPEAAPNARVFQGVIEKSNVQSVIEMSRMIEITRSYQQIAALLQAESELQKAAIEQLAAVPA
jgi:flagellar basal-body rod protein FlgF/flagellar basal-body rod protein FlgG